MREQRLPEGLHLMPGASLYLVAGILIVGTVSCGRSDIIDAAAGTAGDASVMGAVPDATRPRADVTVVDSNVAEEGMTPDSALDASSIVDAEQDGPRANADASPLDAGGMSDAGSMTDAADAGDATAARDAAAPHLPCDDCSPGDQQCGPLPPVCIYNDAGAVLTCVASGLSVWTCVAGDAGCAVWSKGLTCSPDIPCCAPCTYAFNCPVGALGDPCRQDTDCSSDACDAFSHQCVSDPCRDRRQDGEESDVDCGGGTCSACLVGQGCKSNFDCTPGHLCASSLVCE
jgi:hypothetical protein